jgi:transglutaminase-like putative cysteine protease
VGRVRARGKVAHRKKQAGATLMLIRLGYELAYEFTQATPMLLSLHVHYSRTSDLVKPDSMLTEPTVPLAMYRDKHGNWCTRAVAPPGRFRICADALIRDSGVAEPAVPYAYEHSVDSLPDDALEFLLPSRFCDAEHLVAIARERFSGVLPGWSRVQAVCDFVHRHVTAECAKPPAARTASDIYAEPHGSCRDYAHLAIAMCRALNIPARYCTGYLADVGGGAAGVACDFASWFEAYIGGGWQIFDPFNNQRRVGRVLIARGRDAADVGLNVAFGQGSLQKFAVWSSEVHAIAA